jgi:hypothetical protein
MQDGLSASHQGDTTAQLSYSGMLSQQGTALSTTGTCTYTTNIHLHIIVHANMYNFEIARAVVSAE